MAHGGDDPSQHAHQVPVVHDPAPQATTSGPPPATPRPSAAEVPPSTCRPRPAVRPSAWGAEHLATPSTAPYLQERRGQSRDFSVPPPAPGPSFRASPSLDAGRGSVPLAVTGNFSPSPPPGNPGAAAVEAAIALVKARQQQQQQQQQRAGAAAALHHGAAAGNTQTQGPVAQPVQHVIEDSEDNTSPSVNVEGGGGSFRRKRFQPSQPQPAQQQPPTKRQVQSSVDGFAEIVSRMGVSKG